MTDQEPPRVPPPPSGPAPNPPPASEPQRVVVEQGGPKKVGGCFAILAILVTLVLAFGYCASQLDKI